MIARLTAERGVLLADRQKELDRVMQRFEPAIAARSKEIEALEESVNRWADENRKSAFGDKQTLEFSHGVLRYRQGPEKLTYYAGWDRDKALQKLLAFGVTSDWAKYVRREPVLDAQLILRDAKGEKPVLSKARLKVVGLRLEREEFFHVEPKPEAAGKT